VKSGSPGELPRVWAHKCCLISDEKLSWLLQIAENHNNGPCAGAPPASHSPADRRLPERSGIPPPSQRAAPRPHPPGKWLHGLRTSSRRRRIQGAVPLSMVGLHLYLLCLRRPGQLRQHAPADQPHWVLLELNNFG